LIEKRDQWPIPPGLTLQAHPELIRVTVQDKCKESNGTFLFSGQTPWEMGRLLESIALMRKKKHKEAYTVLNRVYRAQQTEAGRVASAFLVTYLQISALPSDVNRADFANDVLTSVFASAVAAGEAARLHRIAGDDAMDSGNFSEARAHFESVFSNSSGEEKDYAVFRLAWIDINEGKQPAAFSRVLNYVICDSCSVTEKMKGLLFNTLGNAWVESGTASSDQEKTLKSNNFKPEEFAAISDGVVEGLLGIGRLKIAKDFGKTLWVSPFASSVAEKIIAEESLHGEEACSSLRWIQPATLRSGSLDRAKASNRVLECKKWQDAAEKELADLSDYAFEIVASTRDWPPKPESSVYKLTLEFLDESSFATKLEAELKERHGSYVRGLVPSLFAEWALANKKSDTAWALFQLYAPATLNLADANDVWSSIFFQRVSRPNEPQTPESTARVRDLLKQLKTTAQHDLQNRIAVLAMKYRLSDDLWAHSSPKEMSPVIREQLARMTLDQFAHGESLPSEDAPTLVHLKKSLAILETRPFTRVAAEAFAKQAGGDPVTQRIFAKDIATLLSIALEPAMAKVTIASLQSSIRRLERDIRTARKFKWTVKSGLLASQSLLVVRCDQAAGIVRSLQAPKELTSEQRKDWDDMMAKILHGIEDWKRQLQQGASS
jgi:hypothetical protein